MEVPWTEERWQDERTRASEDPHYLAQVWWATRSAERRLRAATGRFVPRHKQKRKAFGAKRYTKRGPPAQQGGKAGGRPRRGFFINQSFVSLEHIPEAELQAFFSCKTKSFGRKRSGPPKEVRCFKCGEPGHMAKECPHKEQLCSNCKKPGHLATECPQAQKHF